MISVVMCIYNSPKSTFNAISSILRHKCDLISEVILVDDHSNYRTKKMLQDNFGQTKDIRIIRNTKNLGYTVSANLGLKEATSEFVLLLNSDTEVTSNWVLPMYEAMRDNPEIAVCGPLSNCASWQSVPTLLDKNRNWKNNEIPSGMSLSTFALHLRNLFHGELVMIPFVNGFCSLIRMSAIKAVGYLDEINFPIGYGEENDLAIRLQISGWRLCIVPSAYVFHSKSQSFGPNRREHLSRLGQISLVNKFGEDLIKDLTHAKNYKHINSIRERLVQSLSSF